MKNTTLGYIEYNNAYLMLLRNSRKHDGSCGKWLGIGGKIEPQESADQGFIREVKEETGIDLNADSIKRRGIVDFVSESYESERMFLYTATVDSDYYNPKCNEGSLKWINKSEILGLNLWEGDKYFLQELLDDKKFFVMSLIYAGAAGDTLTDVIKDKLVITDVESLQDSNLHMYTNLNENQLKHINEPDIGVFIAETPVVIDRAVHFGYNMVNMFCEHNMLFEMVRFDYLNAPLFTCSEAVMRDLTGYGLIRGVLSVMKRKALPLVEDLIADTSINKIAVLEDVMNPTNVGAITRSATALGIDAIICTSGCADPLYRRAIRVSMGNIFSVPYSIAEPNWANTLQSAGFKIVSMALSDTAVFINDPKIAELKNQKLAIVFGTESTGISKKLLDKSDYIVKIPMSNEVDSLNVAAASAVAFYALC